MDGGGWDGRRRVGWMEAGWMDGGGRDGRRRRSRQLVRFKPVQSFLTGAICASQKEQFPVQAQSPV